MEQHTVGAEAVLLDVGGEVVEHPLIGRHDARARLGLRRRERSRGRARRLLPLTVDRDRATEEVDSPASRLRWRDYHDPVACQRDGDSVTDRIGHFDVLRNDEELASSASVAKAPASQQRAQQQQEARRPKPPSAVHRGLHQRRRILARGEMP